MTKILAKDSSTTNFLAIQTHRGGLRKHRTTLTHIIELLYLLFVQLQYFLFKSLLLLQSPPKKTITDQRPGQLPEFRRCFYT